MATRPSSPLHLGAALLGPLAAGGVLSGLREQVTTPDAVLVLVLVVVAVAAAGSRVAGVAAALSATVWFDFFLTQPYLSFTVNDRDDVETAVLLTLVGLAVTELALWGRREQARASARAGYLDGLVRTSAQVAAADAAPQVVLDLVAGQVREVLGVERCTYVAGALTSRPRLERDGSVTRGGTPVDVDHNGLPTDDVLELPVARGGAVLGHFELVSAARVVWPTREQRLVAVTLADQAAGVLPSGSAQPSRASSSRARRASSSPPRS